MAGHRRLGLRLSALVACAAAGVVVFEHRPGAFAVQGEPAPARQDPRSALVAALAEQGVALDLEAGLVSIPARVLIRDQLLEYILVGPRGAAHESLFVTEASPTALHTAMLLAGFENGVNARWIPNPRKAEIGARGATYDVLPPESAPGSDGVFLHVGWRSGDDTFFYRVEDLIADLSTGRAMRRHGWVYLGSTEIQAAAGRPAGFAAELQGNLINVAWFEEGHTLVTAALPECVDQTIWTANPWLVPERETPVRFVLSKRPLLAPPESLLESLPEIEDRTRPDEAPERAGAGNGARDDGDDTED